jgi:hypothetical protein
MGRRLYFDFATPLVETRFGRIHSVWQRWLERLFATVNSHQTALDGTIGVNQWTLADQVTGLGTADAGYLAFVTDYGHLVRWTGSVWEFAPGDDGNGYFQHFALTPQQNGWQLCDGSTVAYLVMGSLTITTANIAVPNLVSTPAYLKSGTYSGTRVGANGSTDTESGHTHTGTTDTDGEHTHQVSVSVTIRSVAAGADHDVDDDISASVPNPDPLSDHNHAFTTGGGSAHNHGAGSIEMDRLLAPLYFRR